jgi:hypothetical protein
VQVSPTRLFLHVVQYEKIPGRQQRINGHAYCVEQDNALVARELPLREDEAQFRVVLAGSFTSRERAAILKRYEVRKEKVRKLLVPLMCSQQQPHRHSIANPSLIRFCIGILYCEWQSSFRRRYAQ